jgi:RNA polymerase sigma-70 factor, ECF subfamily
MEQNEGMAGEDHDRIADDAHLVGRARAGDRGAFGELLSRYRESVRGVCPRILGEASEADDVAQEASLQAYLGLDHLVEASSFGPWFHAIAANLARKSIRGRRPTPMGAVHDDQRVLWRSPEPTPEEALAAREVHELILSCLAGVSQVNREALISHYLGGYTYAEMAAILGVSPSTIRGRLFAGRRQLRRVLMEGPRSAWREERMKESELIPVRVGDFVGRTMDLAHRMVLLHEADGPRELPVTMTPDEGDAVEGALAETPPQPPVHALLVRALQAVGGRIDGVLIDRLSENTAYAQVLLTGPGGGRTVEARASDGIALALLSGADVSVARSIFDQEGIDPLDMEQRRELAAAARTTLRKRLEDRGPLPDLDPVTPRQSVDPAVRSYAEDVLRELASEIGARSALLMEEEGGVLAVHGPVDPDLVGRYAAARARKDTDLLELVMLDLFPEDEVDCIIHATSNDGRLRLEASLPIGFGAQTREAAAAQGERLKETIEGLAVLLPSPDG